MGDIAAWAENNRETYNIVFSNTALLPRLLNHVAAGGVLEIRTPGNFAAPAHLIMGRWWRPQRGARIYRRLASGDGM